MSAPRRAVSVLVIFSLNLVITPCALAVAQDNSHCPPAAMQEIAHHEHSAVAEPTDCESLQADCCDLADADLADVRSDKFDSYDDLPAIADSVNWPSLHTTGTAEREIRPPDPDQHSPPLHKLFCVYLN
jgi:hypothetical protein